MCSKLIAFVEGLQTPCNGLLQCVLKTSFLGVQINVVEGFRTHFVTDLLKTSLIESVQVNVVGGVEIHFVTDLKTSFIDSVQKHFVGGLQADFVTDLLKTSFIESDQINFVGGL